MPIKSKIIDNLHCPIVICDHCGYMITDAKEGNYEWKYNVEFHSESAEIFFTHKRCCRAFEMAHKGDWSWMSIDLVVFPLCLGVNLTVDPKEVKEYCEHVRRSGF